MSALRQRKGKVFNKPRQQFNSGKCVHLKHVFAQLRITGSLCSFLSPRQQKSNEPHYCS